MEERKKSGQIPAFGNWDYANELPITQYFESARQAGLVRYTSSGELDFHVAAAGGGGYGYGGGGDLYAVNFNKPRFRAATGVVPPRKTRMGGVNSSKRCPHFKEERKEYDVTEPAKKQSHQNHASSNSAPSQPPPTTTAAAAVKPVDEDLYKIPPDLLHTSKRKKMLGLFSRCLVPACMV